MPNYHSMNLTADEVEEVRRSRKRRGFRDNGDVLRDGESLRMLMDHRTTGVPSPVASGTAEIGRIVLGDQAAGLGDTEMKRAVISSILGESHLQRTGGAIDAEAIDRTFRTVTDGGNPERLRELTRGRERIEASRDAMIHIPRRRCTTPLW